MQSNGQGLNIDHYSSLKNLIDGLVTTDTEDPVYKAFITVKKQTT
jgi:hypothetical protein